MCTKASLNKALQTRSSTSAGRSTDTLFAPQKSAASLPQVESDSRSGGDSASRTASSGASASGASRRSSRTARTAKSGSSGMSTASPEFQSLVDITSFALFAGFGRGGGGGAGAKNPTRPASRASRASRASGGTSSASSSTRNAVSEVDVDEPALTLRDLELLLTSKRMLPHVFSRELVVKTWHNMLAQRAPKIAAYKRNLRKAQREASSNSEALTQRLKTALRLVDQTHHCAQQMLEVDAALTELFEVRNDTEQDLKERLREHVQALGEVTWSIFAKPSTSEMSRLVWVNGALVIKETSEDDSSSKQSEDAVGGEGGGGEDQPQHDEPLTKIGAQLCYEEAQERVEELRMLLAADDKLPRKAAEIARLKIEETKVKKRLAGSVMRRDRLFNRLEILHVKHARLAQVAEHVEDNPGMDIFLMLDDLEHQSKAHRQGGGEREKRRSSRGGKEEGKEEGDAEEEAVAPAPLALIAKYREWTVDLNYEIAEAGACELLLENIEQGLDRLRSVTADDEGQEAPDDDMSAFRDRQQLHRALTRLAEIATKHKTAIRRRLQFQKAIARKKASKRKILAEIQTLKRELQQLEESRETLETVPPEGLFSGVVGGAAGEARRKALLENLSSMPEPGLRTLCKHYSVRLPGRDGSFATIFPALVRAMYSEEIKKMGDKCKELRKAIGISATASIGDCDKFESDDVDADDPGDLHPLLQAAMPTKRGLRAVYLALHVEMLQAEREVRDYREAETAYRLEWVTHHQSVRSRERQSRKRELLLAMEGEKREALREALETGMLAIVCLFCI